MTLPQANDKLNYVEFSSQNIAASKAFFAEVFGWQFTDYGPDYTAFAAEQAGMDGGFYHGEKAPNAEQGAPLIVFYANDLEASQRRVEMAGGEICKAIFSFPGGRRFQFIEPGGNELAVWSDK